jgi:hypothetical protein
MPRINCPSASPSGMIVITTWSWKIFCFILLIRRCFSRWDYTKNDIVCQWNNGTEYQLNGCMSLQITTCLTSGSFFIRRKMLSSIRIFPFVFNVLFRKSNIRLCICFLKSECVITRVCMYHGAVWKKFGAPNFYAQNQSFALDTGQFE